MTFSKNIFPYCSLIIFISACTPKEDVGLARYFIKNNSDFDIAVKFEYIKSVSVDCDSCFVGKQSEKKSGNDSNFGHAPNPQETIKSIKVYKNDLLKINISAPYADTLFKNVKGEGVYDWDFFLEIENGDLN